MSLDVSTPISAPWLAGNIAGTRADDIQRSLASLISSGAIPQGARLPTIREVAEAVGASVGAVSEAWGVLRRDGLLDTRRRGGTIVSLPRPVASTSGFAGWESVELARGTADRGLLPSLGPALVAAVDTDRGSKSLAITRNLRESVSDRWPFEADDFVAVSGVHSGLRLAMAAALEGTNKVIAVEDPTCIRSIGIVRSLGASVITVASDEHGPLPESLAEALRHDPAAFYYQPVAQVPTGSSLTTARRQELAEQLTGRDLWILEEDPAGTLAEAGESLGRSFPDTTVRVTQYARAYGSDLQTAVVGGSARLVDQVLSLQRLQGVSVSPLLQDALAWLVTNPEVDAQIATARSRYAERHASLAEALRNEGVVDLSSGGFFAWLPVQSEVDTLMNLGDLDIKVSAGSRGFFRKPQQEFVRVSTTHLPDSPELVADLARHIAAAMRDSVISEYE